jgi:hypothetical protein
LIDPMNASTEQRSTRREVLLAAARYAAAGGIAVLSAALVVKTYLVPEEARCRLAAACRGCRAAADCGLPAAVRFRGGKEG